MEQYLIYAGVILGGLSFILLIIENLRLNGMIRKYKRLIRGLRDKNVEDLMVDYSRELENVKEALSGRIEERISDLETKMPTCLRNQGMLTYNAFDNMGNNMSFSVGALDDQKNGFIITGIYSRDYSYVYAKRITEGQSDKELSKEEKEVLAQALKER